MKKILKRTLLFLLLTPVVLLVIGFFFYLLVALLAVGGESSTHQAYLNHNKEIIRPGAENKFAIFDTAFYSNQIFLLGEVHGFAMPQVLDMELLTHLNRKVGLKHYLAEVDYSQAYFLNQYLQTGNDSLLNYVFQTWVTQNAQWGNKNFYRKIQQIRSLNMTFPTSKQISIIGVDKIQDIAVTRRFLRQSLKQIAYQEGVNSSMDSLALLAADDTLSMFKLGAKAKQVLQKLETDTAAKQLLQKHAFHCLYTLRNIAYFNPNIRRDSVMFLNLKELTSVFGWENEKMYGMWGFFHTLQLPMKREVKLWPFATLIKHSADSPFKQKVVSLNVYALDSENMMPGKMMPASISKGKAYFNTSWANSDGPLVFVNGIKDLRAVTTQNSITIFRLDGNNSPYHTSSLLAKTSVLIPGQSMEAAQENTGTSSLFQYIFLVRNSPALVPIEQ